MVGTPKECCPYRAGSTSAYGRTVYWYSPPSSSYDTCDGKNPDICSAVEGICGQACTSADNDCCNFWYDKGVINEHKNDCCNINAWADNHSSVCKKGCGDLANTSGVTRCWVDCRGQGCGGGQSEVNNYYTEVVCDDLGWASVDGNANADHDDKAYIVDMWITPTPESGVTGSAECYSGTCYWQIDEQCVLREIKDCKSSKFNITSQEQISCFPAGENQSQNPCTNLSPGEYYVQIYCPSYTSGGKYYDCTPAYKEDELVRIVCSDEQARNYCKCHETTKPNPNPGGGGGGDGGDGGTIWVQYTETQGTINYPNEYDEYDVSFTSSGLSRDYKVTLEQRCGGRNYNEATSVTLGPKYPSATGIAGCGNCSNSRGMPCQQQHADFRCVVTNSSGVEIYKGVCGSISI